MESSVKFAALNPAQVKRQPARDAVAIIIGIADYSWTKGDYTFTGIVNGTLVAVIGYHVLHAIAKARGK